MNCEKCENLISHYLENELEEEVKKDLEQHLEDCESCRQQLEVLKLMQGMLKQEETDIQTSSAMRVKIYKKLFRDFLILFTGLVIIVSVVSVTGGLAQMFLIDQISSGVRIFFFMGILLLIVGITILIYDVFVDIFKIIANK